MMVNTNGIALAMILSQQLLGVAFGFTAHSPATGNLAQRFPTLARQTFIGVKSSSFDDSETPRGEKRAVSSSSTSSTTRLYASSVVSAGPNNGQRELQRLLSKAIQVPRRLIQSLRSNEVTRWRAAAFLFVSCLTLFRQSMDMSLAHFWTFLTTSPNLLARAFRHDHWEWMLSVSCFFVYIHGFLLADRAVLKATKAGKDHPLRKHRLEDRLVAQQHYASLLRRKEESSDDVNMSEGPPMLKEHSKWNVKGYIGELWVYILPLYLWDVLDPRRHRGIARALHTPPTTWGICRDVTLGLLLYDLFFFMGHLLMHKIPLVYRTIHKKHHHIPEVRAGDIVRLSMVEEVMEVGFSIIALRMLKPHMLTRSIYNMIITFLLTELHCGFDFPWTPQNVVPFGLATGSRRHHYHHRYGRHYYQKFFFHVDRLFHFHHKNDGSVMGDTVRPLQSIRDRMSWPKNAAAQSSNV